MVEMKSLYENTKQQCKHDIASFILIMQFLFAALFIPISCKEDYSPPYSLIQADRLLQRNPMLAMRILQTKGQPFEEAPLHEKMYYQLIYATAAELMEKPLRSDSTMLRVADYYERNGSVDELARTYFIIGRINEHNSNYIVALNYYQKSVDKAINAKNYDLLIDANEEIESLFLSKRLPNKSLASYKKAYIERTKKLYEERDLLQSEGRKQTFVIIVFIVVAVFLITLMILIYVRRRRNVALSDSNRDFLTTTNLSNIANEELDSSSYPIYFKIRQNASKTEFRLPKNEWEFFFKEMDSLYSSFTMRLRSCLPRITDMELMVCCLTKLEVRNVDIAHILCRGESSVSSIRSRLYEKINGVKGSSRLFDEFIRAF